MLIAVAGDTHGDIDLLYECVDALEREAGRAVDLVLQVGDFGVWPDPERLDEATRKHGDRGIYRQFLQRGAVPRPTIFIAGNHEDFDHLTERRADELIENLWFLPWGGVTEFTRGGERLRVGGLGGCYGPRDYRRERLTGSSRRHYLAREIESLTTHARNGLDVLLLHEPPAGRVTELHAPPGFKPRTWALAGEGLADLVATVRPRVCFTGHIHARTERRIEGVRTVGLQKVARRGSVIVQELPADGGDARDLAEWGGAPDALSTLPDESALDLIAAEAELDAMVEHLARWAHAITGGEAPSRDARKRMHATLQHDPLRAVLMGALTGADVRGLIERTVPPRERAAIVQAWEADALPRSLG